VTPKYDEPIPEHVAQYLARVALAHIPASVYETLLSLTPEELAVLERVGMSFKESEFESHSWTYVIH
jgi:threonine/homoserine efflux transporter RhtA